MAQKVRICWPNPDIICIEGGCIHCVDSNHLVDLAVLRQYASERSWFAELQRGLERNLKVVDNG